MGIFVLVPREEAAIEVVPAGPSNVVPSSVGVRRRAEPRTIASLNSARLKVVPSLPGGVKGGRPKIMSTATDYYYIRNDDSQK
jgi:hypothetical protein